MKIQGALLLPILGVLILFSTSRATDELENDDTSHKEDDTTKEKISTSLKIPIDFKNQTASRRGAQLSTMKLPEKKEPIVELNKSTGITISSSVSKNYSEPLMKRIDHIVGSGGRENTTKELTLPSRDLVAMFSEEDSEDEEDTSEAMPEALELRSSRLGYRRHPYYRPGKRPPSSNRRNVFPVEAPLRSSKRPSRRPTESKREPTDSDCTFFSKTVCLESANYPHEAIMRSIRGNKEMISALLTDYNVEDADNDYRKSLPLENRFEKRFENRYENNEIKRRSDYPSPLDNVEEGFTCPSQVLYARPQLARAVSGVWKYIINTGEHTQTLRLEKCSKPKSSCSFISENYRSSCTQVYNYHRLLTWESGLGLHMDIFKVPSCCSCHVHGYAELYPPLQKDPLRSPAESFPGAEFATEQVDDGSFDRPTSYLTKFKPTSNLDNNFVAPGGSKPILDAGSSNRPSFSLPGKRGRPKKPAISTSGSRPFDKLPQQHAPNTRAPGYKGPIVKSVRPIRINRPYRRESNTELEENSSASSVNNWFSQPFDQESDTSSGLHNGGFDEEYQEPNRRVNYNYHPILDFFKPEASMLQAPEGLVSQSTSIESEAENSWKPMMTS